MTIKQIMCGLSALALSGSLTPAAYAATDTGTLTVKARIGAACTLKTNGATLDFGTLTTISDKDHFAEEVITVQCSKDQAYSIGLGQGVNNENATHDGYNRMKSGTNFIVYGLYRDAAHLLYWGNRTGRRILATGDGNEQKHTIYGQIYVNKTTPPAGDYTDTVGITVEY